MSAQHSDSLNGQTNPLPSPNPSLPSENVADESNATTSPLASLSPDPVDPPRPLTGLEQVRLRRMKMEAELAKNNAELAKKNSQITPPVDVGHFPAPAPAPRPSTRPRVWTSYEEDEDEAMGLGVNLVGGVSVPATPYSTPRKRAGRKTLNTSNGTAFDGKVLQGLIEGQDEGDEEEDIVTPRASRKGRKNFDGLLGQGSETKKKDPIHRPKKEKGARAIGPVDNTPAVRGQEDESKFRIEFDTEKPDPANPTLWIPSKRVSYNLHDIDPLTFDFNNPKHIKRINIWRRQILGRNFPKQRKTRQFWLEIEQAYVIHLVRSQLAVPGTRRVKWNRVANAYNERFHGRVQRVGERLLMVGRQNLPVIQNERQAPWRTAAAIMGMAAKWAVIRSLIEGIKTDVRRVGEREVEGEDEAEIPDPKPEPEPGVTPRKYARYGKKKEEPSEEEDEESEEEMEELDEKIVSEEEEMESSDSDTVMLL